MLMLMHIPYIYKLSSAAGISKEKKTLKLENQRFYSLIINKKTYACLYIRPFSFFFDSPPQINIDNFYIFILKKVLCALFNNSKVDMGFERSKYDHVHP